MASGDFWIEGNGVEIVHKFASTPLLNVQRTMTAPQDSVSASLDSGVVDVDYDISGTGSNVLVTRARLTNPSNVVNYPPDSLVELSSEDVAPHGSTTLDFPRMGQVLRVARTENDGTNGYIYFATTAWRSDLYQTDIRVTLMPVGETYINNVKLSIEAASGENLEVRLNPVIWLQNCLYPKVTNVDIIESSSLGITLIRCVGGSIRGNKIRKVRFATGEAAPSNSRLGYAVFWSACNGMNLSGNYATNCRHAITDNWTNSSAAGLVHRHGPNINNIVEGNVAEFTRGAGFDSHSSSVGTLFIGNSASGARSDSSGLGAGYQIRGESNVLIGNVDKDCEAGVQCFENTIDGSQDTIVAQHTSRAKKIGLVTALQSGITSTRKQNINVIGGLFETYQVGAAAGKVFQIDNAKVNFRGTTVRPHGQNGGNIVTVAVGNTDISGEIIYDASAAAGAWSLLSTAGTGNTFALTTRRDADDGVGADANIVVTDLSPDYILLATTLTADRTLTFSCTGRKRVTIYRTGAGAFNRNITHSGGVLALATNRGAVFEVFGALVTLVGIIPADVASAPGLLTAIIEDQKTSGTAGGTFTNGADRVRTLNTLVYNRNSTVSLATNQFTLPAGSWVIEWTAPGHQCGLHQSFLYDITATAEVARGSSSSSDGTTFSTTQSVGAARVTPVASNVYEIRHRCGTTQATNGFGAFNGFGTEVYTRVVVRTG